TRQAQVDRTARACRFALRQTTISWTRRGAAPTMEQLRQRPSHLEDSSMSKGTSRRDFLKTTAVTGGAIAAGLSAVANVHAGGNNNQLRIGLIGCGGRGTGAAEQCLRADSNVRLVAVGDTLRDRANACLQHLRNAP